MKILLVSEMIPCLPSHDGFRLIPANLIRNLCQRHEIHLVALSYGKEREEQSEWPRAYCKSVSIYRSSRVGRARLRALTGAVDPALSHFVGDAIESVRPTCSISKAEDSRRCFGRARVRSRASFACMTRRRCAIANSPSMPRARRSEFV